MQTEDSDELAAGSRPTAEDGPFTLTVDGEIFTVTIRPEAPGDCDYDWESGPNEGYGYSSFQLACSPSTVFRPSTIGEHRESIRDFLSQIDPETGHLGD
jgi:hypothetical protein